MNRLKKVHLLTGGNLGDRQQNLQAARQLISEKIGTVVKASNLYETAAWGHIEQPEYLNQALEVATELSPIEVLQAILEIENLLGRRRRSKWEARNIDIDILFYGSKILKTNDLTIPHPLLHRRNFALIPMLEIAPMKKHPLLGKTIEELYESSEDDLEVVVLDNPMLASNNP